MDPNKKENAYQKHASQSSVPVRYRCKVGGEWKPLQYYSKNQQKLLQRQISSHARIDAANSGMTCIEHSAGFRGEICCSLCGLIKPLEDFSKSMRKSDDPTCIRCTAWGETQEPGVTPTPLQTGHISVEEENRSVWNRKFTESTDFFPDDITPQVPITALSSIGISSGDAVSKTGLSTSSKPPGSVGAISSLESEVSAPISGRFSHMPPHLEDAVSKLMQNHGLRTSAPSEKQSQKTSSSLASTDFHSWLNGPEASSEIGTKGGYHPERKDVDQNSLSGFGTKLPPHLQGKVPSIGPSRRRFVGPSSQSSDKQSISTVTTMRNEQEIRETQSKIPYNAWDNTGKLYNAMKSPTASERDSLSTASNSSAYEEHNEIGDWVNVPVIKKNRQNINKSWHKAPRLESSPE